MNIDEDLKDFIEQQKEEFWNDHNKGEEIYNNFMAQYKLKHKCCPKCGAISHRSTLVGYVFNSDSPDTYKDQNRCTCIECGDIHTTHDRVAKQQ